ncbi:MAG: hypothetical protein JWO87_3995, partial [Phycisphaerales bacterium]|nr:hypothetical protein [Phycisphaerales bacterium]
MRACMIPAIVAVCFLAPASSVRAQDKAAAIIDKAIAAQGGPEKLKKLRSMRITVSGRGTLVPGQDATPIEIEDAWQMPERYKTTLRLQSNGIPVTMTQGVDGTTGWISANGQTQPMPEAALAEMKEQKYAEDLDRLL